MIAILRALTFAKSESIMLNTILNVAQIVLAVLLVASILLQAKGTGLGAAFGGGGTVAHTKRGFEKTLHTTTVVIAIIFFVVALANALF